MSNLHRFVQCYDFAVLVLSDDDVTISRKHTQVSPRDNVVLELGLFMGALGRRRTFVVIAQTDDGPPKIPSDLLGNTAVYLPKNAHKNLDQKGLAQQLEQLVSTIATRSNESTLQLLPSTGLAIGYFENFVAPVCQQLVDSKTVTIEGVHVDIKSGNFQFTVVLPASLTDASIEGAKKYYKKNQFQQFTLQTSGRSFPFYVESKVQKGCVLFYDYPTTLRASQEAVQIALAGPYLGREEYHSLLDLKEINNFERTLRILLEKPSAAGFRANVKIIRTD